MASYWIGISGEPTPNQCDRLGAAGLVRKGHSGDAFSGTIYRTYYLVKAPGEQAAIDQVATALPELRQEWENAPLHLILVTDDHSQAA